MSAYISFFIRSKNDEFIEFSVVSRNNQVFQHAQHWVNYGRIAQVNLNKINSAISDINDELGDCFDTQELYEQKIKDVASFNNSVDEKLEALHEYRKDIIEIDEEIKGLMAAVQFFNFLKDMIGQNCRIYVGYECGPDVTVNDINGDDK